MLKFSAKQFVRVSSDVYLCYDLADYTEPWAEKEPETILLHHGYLRNMAFFHTWVPLLGDRFRVLRIDARGCGDSAKPTDLSGYTIKQLAADARAVLDALSIQKVHYVGESSGGVVGMRFALDYQERLHSLTLCSTPIRRKKETASAFTLGEESQEAAIRKFGVGEVCRRTINLRIDMKRSTPALREWISQEMEKTPSHVAIGMHLDIGKQDFSARLHEIKVPTLLLSSGGSAVASEQHVREMNELMPHAKAVSFGDIGHGLNLLEPKRCTDEIRKFLDEAKAAGK